MTLNWKSSEIKEVNINWQKFEANIPINPHKELLSLSVELINNEDFAAFFDLISMEKNITNDKLYGSQVAYIPFEGADIGDTINRTFFGALNINKIVRISYVPEISIIGSSIDHMQLQIVHDPSGEILSTKTFVDEVSCEQRLVFDFGPINPTLATLAAGESLRLVKQDVGTGMILPRGLLIIQWDIA